jgi:hypothetical protein
VSDSEGGKAATKLKIEGEVTLTSSQKESSESKKSGQSSGCLLYLLFLMISLVIALLVLAGGGLGGGGVGGSLNGGSSIGIQSAGGTSQGCEPGIGVGGEVKVNLLPGARMRTSPGYRIKDDSVDTICCVRLGRRLQVLGGPQMADGICWWRVRDEVSNNEGWVADHTESGRRLLKPSE